MNQDKAYNNSGKPLVKQRGKTVDQFPSSSLKLEKKNRHQESRTALRTVLQPARHDPKSRSHYQKPGLLTGRIGILARKSGNKRASKNYNVQQLLNPSKSI